MRKELFFCALNCFCFSGCAAGSDVGVTESAIVGGEPTGADPQVGVFWGPVGPCTATLIGPRAILTAAHCFEYQSNPTATATGWTFNFSGFTNAREIEGFVALSSNPNDYWTPNDIAVAALDREVDPTAEGVYWSELGTQFPTEADRQLLWYGYGCGDYTTDSKGLHDCDGDSDYTSKRSLAVSWWAVNNKDFALRSEDTMQKNLATHGDSGGPLLDGAYIIGVNSRTITGENNGIVHTSDRFANVVGNNANIRNALAQLAL